MLQSFGMAHKYHKLSILVSHCTYNVLHAMYFLFVCKTGLAGFHPVGEVGGGGKLPHQNTQLPPQKGRGKKKERREREVESVYVFVLQYA